MAIFRVTDTIPAGGVNTNLLNGSKFEFLGRPSAVSLFASQDGAGAPNANLDLTMGNVVVGEDVSPNTAAMAGNISRDSDGVGSGVGDAGDRIQLRARNLSAADPVNINVLVDISELA